MTRPAPAVLARDFVPALLFAPVVAAIFVGIPLLIILPLGVIVIFATYYGYVSFVLVGGPLLWLSVRLAGNNPFCHVIAAFLAVSLLSPLGKMGIPLIPDPFMAQFGYLVAPIWALIFGWLYGQASGQPMRDLGASNERND